MLEVLTFIFSNFWIWLGTVILFETIFEGIRHVVRGKPDRKISEKRLLAILEKNREEK